MEYALLLDEPGALGAPGAESDPRQWCDAPWAGALPPGRLAAVYFGSEFCEERLPAAREAAAFCALARGRGLEAVLLTPVVRPRGLERLERLLDRLVTEGWAPSVVFNDWGVESLLREKHPSLSRRGGRLLNRALRDPRVAAAGAAPRAGARGGHIRGLLRQTGAAAVETDADLEGGFLGPGGEGLQRTLHLPYVFATSGRHCLLRQDSAACGAPCRSRWVPEARADTPLPLHRDGNTLVYEAPEAVALAHVPAADRIVLQRRPAP